MASFDAFFPTLLKHESGFVNDPADPGGTVNKGITLGTFQKYAKQYLGIEPTIENLRALTDAQAAKIYKPLHWDAVRGDEIQLQELANIVFDFQVNVGIAASKLLQSVLNTLGAKPPLALDGNIGPGTMAALNRMDQMAVYKYYKQHRIDYYQDLVAKRPALGKFLNGWLKRVNSFPDLSPSHQSSDTNSSTKAPAPRTKRGRQNVAPNAAPDTRSPTRSDELWIVSDSEPSPRLLEGITSGLADWLRRARNLHHVSNSASDGFDVSFTALFVALFSGEDEWSEWARQVAEKIGLDVARVATQFGVPPEVVRDPAQAPSAGASSSAPLRLTSSARDLFRHAEKSVSAFSRPIGVEDLIAALVFEPGEHEKELLAWGFDANSWANALVARGVEVKHPWLGIWRRARDDRWPTMPPQDTAPTEELEWEFLKDDLAWAEAFRIMGGDAAISPRHLYGVWVHKTGESETDVLVALAGLDAAPTSGNLRDELHQRLGVSPPLAPVALKSRPILDDDMQRALNTARSLPLDEPASRRGFLGLFLPPQSGGPAPIDGTLRAAGIDPDTVLARLRDVARTKDLPVDTLSMVIVRRRTPAWERSGFDSDRVAGAISEDLDRLDLKRPAARFAKLVASTEVDPPIALGLFGNWGSGKSFFMGLMRDYIQKLSAGKDPAYERRIVQIEFNAWHYHDTSLWACLAMRIFESLAFELGDRDADNLEAKRKELHKKIHSSEARRREATERRKRALDRRAQATGELEKKRAERSEVERDSVRLRLEAAWRVVVYGESFKDLRSTAAGVAEHFGVDAAIKSAEDLQHLRRDIAATSERALGLFTAIGQRFRDVGTGAKTTGWLVLAAASALALGWGVEALAKRAKLQLPDLSGTVVQVAAIISTAAAWCGRRVKDLRTTIDRIGAVEAELAEAEKKIPASPEMAKLQTNIENLDKEIHQAGEELGAAEREIAVATAEIERIDSGGLVYEFLQDRKASAQYAAQLGLVSTIRTDFEKLDKLLADFGKHGKDPIKRIVLYIDDLDRCHPSKVVEVLQAVHLLLAFKLFNVVVGVDARWLERSLYRQYVSGVGGARRSGTIDFSPQDYLEKIFQIPYVLAPMDAKGFGALVDGLITTRSDVEREQQEARARRKAEEARREAVPTTEEQKGLPTTPVDAEGKTKAEVGVAEQKTEEKSGEAVANKDNAGNVDAALAQAGRFFEDHEETFIQGLHAFIDRPRLAKRFVNIYRLLRVRAAEEGDIQFAESPDSEGYRAALVLLAINVGFARISTRVLQDLERATGDERWGGFVAAISREESRSMHSHVDRLEYARMAKALEALASKLPENLEPYRTWAPRIACFSFGWYGQENGEDGWGKARSNSESARSAR